MTSLDKAEQSLEHPAAATPQPGKFAFELSETLKLALPIAATQLGQIAMMTTDLALIGRLGDAAVAAAALAHTVFFVNFTFGMGLVAAGAPPASPAVGARNPGLVGGGRGGGGWGAPPGSPPRVPGLAFWGKKTLLARR